MKQALGLPFPGTTYAGRNSKRPFRLWFWPVLAAAHPADGAMDGGEGSGRDRWLAAVVVTEISGPGAATVVESIPVDGPLPPVGTTAAGSIAVNLPSIAEALLHQFGGPVPAPAVRIQNGGGFFPYSLLHAWAIRSIHHKMDPSIAAKMMDHSVEMYTRNYHYYLSKQDMDKAYVDAIGT